MSNEEVSVELSASEKKLQNLRYDLMSYMRGKLHELNIDYVVKLEELETIKDVMSIPWLKIIVVLGPKFDECYDKLNKLIADDYRVLFIDTQIIYTHFVDKLHLKINEFVEDAYKAKLSQNGVILTLNPNSYLRYVNFDVESMKSNKVSCATS